MEIITHHQPKEALEDIAKFFGCNLIVHECSTNEVGYSAWFDTIPSPIGSGKTSDDAIHDFCRAISFQELTHGSLTRKCGRVYWAFPQESEWAAKATKQQQEELAYQAVREQVMREAQREMARQEMVKKYQNHGGWNAMAEYERRLRELEMAEQPIANKPCNKPWGWFK